MMSADVERLDWYGRVRAVRSGEYPAREAVFDRNELVRREAVLSPGLPKRLQYGLRDDPSVAVRVALASRADLDADTRDALVEDGDARVLRAMASRADLDAGQLTRLSAVMDAHVQRILGLEERAAYLDSLPVAPALREKARRGVFG